MSAELTKLRRSIHTYPFKYSPFQADRFFGLQNGALYVHIPFCSTKCHFCDFTVYVNKTDDMREQYVQRLCTEIARFPEQHPMFPRFKIDAIYFGGGTPGLLSSEQLIRILQTCRQTYSINPGCEITIEFDPDSVSLEKALAVKEAGFTRVSVGVQSFNDDLLKQSNRPHTARSVHAAFETLRKVGFTNTNLDLIYPLPGLTMDVWMDSVQQALRLEPACISLYGLEVWPGTAFHNWLEKGKLKLPNASTEVEMYTAAVDALESEGFVARSTNGYVHPGRAEAYSRFLDYYWRTWPMLGFGVSSKSAYDDRLWANVKGLKDYIQRVDAGEPVVDLVAYMSKAQEMRRVMIRGLKACEVSKQEFLQRFGVEMESVFGDIIGRLVADGLLANEDARVCLTRKGRTFGTNVYEYFYTDEDRKPATQNEVQFGISHLVTTD
ncbi:radical SAM family heme chaperone HemW [Corallococcus exercitus]|uniref:Heme chaperone HemW n=1 Tax=Corallococcus exercitus TaxID=2316736 RepID=A0A7Y4KGM6_9BACT|nr:radical SAM family heme chaperone HemW [Corallococcus exercitus]NOK33331.1 radical SAM family heme chaperone HemW [Corallococcus exercitus]